MTLDRPALNATRRSRRDPVGAATAATGDPVGDAQVSDSATLEVVAAGGARA